MEGFVVIAAGGECRLASTEFDIAASAGWYSAIAGTLAGFALLSILFPLDHETIRSNETDDQANSDAVVTYTCAFFALLILAFTYAVLAGRTGDGPAEAVAAHEQLLAGSAFGLSTLLMLYGLHAVLKTYGANRGVFASAQRVIVRVTSLYGPAAVIALQFSSALDLERLRSSGSASLACGPGGIGVGVWIDLLIVAVALLALVVLATLERRLPRSSRAPAVVAKATLGWTLAVTAWCAIVLPLLPIPVVASASVEHLALLVGAATSVSFAVAARMGR